ncbi:hypothetical protein BJ508DRAFT_346012 [Ascobolus immersus RN42]|uniref:Uncharacterized protein n=1 Tax=Ascobolus immersus RN42 TaxID=1160509 RepID=A0A3N4I5Z0_ASCIM|nr:hypothetical protein BJ508DRAFT_346012 [Ascobolus immersus RN42]
MAVIEFQLVSEEESPLCHERKPPNGQTQTHLAKTPSDNLERLVGNIRKHYSRALTFDLHFESLVDISRRPYPFHHNIPARHPPRIRHRQSPKRAFKFSESPPHSLASSSNLASSTYGLFTTPPIIVMAATLKFGDVSPSRAPPSPVKQTFHSLAEWGLWEMQGGLAEAAITRWKKMEDDVRTGRVDKDRFLPSGLPDLSTRSAVEVGTMEWQSMGRFGGFIHKNYRVTRVCLKDLFGVAEGSVASMEEHYEEGQGIARVTFRNGKIFDWEESMVRNRGRWIGEDGVAGPWMKSLEESEGVTEDEGHTDSGDCVESDEDEESDNGIPESTFDPFALSDLDTHRLLGYWRFPELLYLDPVPEQYDALTSLYIHYGMPPVNNTEQKEQFRELWEEAKCKDNDATEPDTTGNAEYCVSDDI